MSQAPLVERKNFDSEADWDEYIEGLAVGRHPLRRVMSDKQMAWSKRIPGLCAGDYSVGHASHVDTYHIAHPDPDVPPMEGTEIHPVDEAARRKAVPVYSGFDCYFPDAIAKVAELSRIGNDQHNPGTDLHWDRSKSGDELDSLKRHLLDHASGRMLDTDGVWHLTKVAWRAMAALQKECERVQTPEA